MPMLASRTSPARHCRSRCFRSRQLTGLSCAGQFEIQTAYYTGFNASTGKVGAAVIPSASVTGSAAGSATGDVVLWLCHHGPMKEGMQLLPANTLRSLFHPPTLAGQAAQLAQALFSTLVWTLAH